MPRGDDASHGPPHHTKDAASGQLTGDRSFIRGVFSMIGSQNRISVTLRLGTGVPAQDLIKVNAEGASPKR